MNPFSEQAETDAEDRELVRDAQSGNRGALEQLITRHQPWIYNIVLRMLYWPNDAEDVTQEILIKLTTKLSTFEGRSGFRTWLYRIAVNHILNVKRRDFEDRLNFVEYGHGLDATPDMDLPDPNTLPADAKLIIDEARIGCTSGMLLCLDREQRLIYILGAIFGVSDRVGAVLLDISRDNFRQKLSRARRDLHSFMQNQCGLVNTVNPCRCAKKALGFAKAGYLNPENLLFARDHVTRVREVSEKRADELDALDAQYAEIHRDHPFQSSPDFVASLQELFNDAKFKSIAELE